MAWPLNSIRTLSLRSPTSPNSSKASSSPGPTQPSRCAGGGRASVFGPDGAVREVAPHLSERIIDRSHPVLAVIVSIPAFVAVYRVTKTRVNLAQKHFGLDTMDSGLLELDDVRKSSNGTSPAQTAHRAIAQARSEHYFLCIQFASAAVLLLAAAGALLVDVILGWEVHTKSSLTAMALLIPILSYALQATVSLVLIMVGPALNAFKLFADLRFHP